MNINVVMDMSSLYLLFTAEQLGIMVPGNDVMSAIVSLFIEVFSYGVLICALILFLLFYIIDNFTHNVEGMDAPVAIIYDIDVRATSNFTLFCLYVVNLFVSIMCGKPTSSNVLYPRYFKKWQESFLDICFLVFPTIVVILMLVPTLGFLYNSHFILYSILDTSLYVDVIGHQWYWSYEYNLGSEDNDFMFDSILDIDAIVNAYLEVDTRFVIPTDLAINVTITSTDVIHSWAVPNLGIKVDAVPGRLSTSMLYTYVNGIFYGQCSELCGVLHGFMTICVESVPIDLFFHWAMIQSNFVDNIY
jgi:heme/copper-type cytochrome/quinol oxidase subunit 2